MIISQDEIMLAEEKRTSSLIDLELFKMMLQPHFLFNSLNNLYALSIKKSDMTAEAIAGLSGLLARVVSCSRMEYIPLSREVHLIEEYIGLERIWLGETSFLLDFQVVGQTEEFMIPPLVLYTFIENAFKHGIRKCNGDGWLTVRVEVKNNRLHFTAKNRMSEDCQELEEESEKQTGLGIKAVEELLEKKCAGRYSMETGAKGAFFQVHLVICPPNDKKK